MNNNELKGSNITNELYKFCVKGSGLSNDILNDLKNIAKESVNMTPNLTSYLESNVERMKSKLNGTE